MSSSPHTHHLQTCLSLARKSPPRPTNFRVGALLLLRSPNTNNPDQDTILSTGYTLELPGNTHAEQCCFAKYASSHNLPEERVGEVLPPPPSSDGGGAVENGGEVVLYVTMEPCGKRLSGNMPCVQRIIQTRNAGEGKGVRKVYFGVKEPGTFVGESEGCRMLTEAGVEWEVVPGLEEEILKVAKEGHEGEENKGKGTNVDDISPEERKRQEQLPRNPKKRMMEIDNELRTKPTFHSFIHAYNPKALTTKTHPQTTLNANLPTPDPPSHNPHACELLFINTTTFSAPGPTYDPPPVIGAPAFFDESLFPLFSADEDEDEDPPAPPPPPPPPPLPLPLPGLESAGGGVSDPDDSDPDPDPDPDPVWQFCPAGQQAGVPERSE